MAFFVVPSHWIYRNQFFRHSVCVYLVLLALCFLARLYSLFRGLGDRIWNQAPKYSQYLPQHQTKRLTNCIMKTSRLKLAEVFQLKFPIKIFQFGIKRFSLIKKVSARFISRIKVCLCCRIKN